MPGEKLSLAAASVGDRLLWVPFLIVGIAMLIGREAWARRLRASEKLHPLMQPTRWSEGGIAVFALIWIAVCCYEIVHG
jgi:hypothetical protein